MGSLREVARDRDWRGGPRLPYLSPLARARALMARAVVCPLLRGSSPTRGVAPKQHRGPPRLPYLSPLRARALLARPWSARCYGVARQREGSRQNSIGGGVALDSLGVGYETFPEDVRVQVVSRSPR